MTTVEHLATRDAFLCAWASEIGTDLHPATADTLLARGWTVPLIEHLGALATFALEHRTGLTIPAPAHASTGGTLIGPLVAERLAALLQVLTEGGAMPLDTACAWLAAVVASPHPEPHNAVQQLAWTDPDTGQVVADWASRTQMTAWTESAPGPVPAWAWAAGLTPEETAHGWAAGTLAGDGLRALAALRGFRLPSD